MKNNEPKLLLVDDHTVVRKGMKLLIHSKYKDMKIMEANNGEEGLALIENNDFDLVITDITMPKMGGLELCKTAMEKKPDIKILIISMHLDEMYIKEAVKMGAKGYLTKSMVDETEILTGIEAVLKGNTFYGKKTSQILIKGLFDNEDRKLTPKEIKVARFLSNGLVYKEIADKLNISTRTVETHRKNILDKLDLETTADIIKYSIKHGIVLLD